MNVKVTQYQFNFLLEFERKNQDKKYEKQYELLKNNFLKYLDNKTDSYSENDSSIALYDKSGDRILHYMKDSEELYINRIINELMMDLMPHYLWMRHGDYIIADWFHMYFDNPVKYVSSAGMF